MMAQVAAKQDDILDGEDYGDENGTDDEDFECSSDEDLE